MEPQVNSKWHHGGCIKQWRSNYRAKRSVVRKTSQWYAAECVRACCVCLAISVCVSKRLEKRERGQRRQQKERRKRRGMSIAKGGWGWKERGGKRLTGPARTHHPNQL